jgi:ligand-binding sensor domain-containing protein
MRIRQIVLVVLLQTLLCFHATKGQVNSSVFENLLTELESKSLYVNAIIQDKNGFIWFGTEEGLIRYDGATLHSYLPEIGNSRSISNKWIMSLFEDSKGNLWIGTRNGLNLYDEGRNEFFRFENNRNNSSSLSNNEVSTIAEDRHGNVWVGTFSGLNKMVTTKNSKWPDKNIGFRRFMKTNDASTSLLSNTVWTLYFDSLNNGWIGTDEGLDLMTTAGESSEYHFTPFRNDPSKATSIAKDNVLKIFSDEKGNLWFTSKQAMLDKLSWESIVSKNYEFDHVLPLLNNSLTEDVKFTNTFISDMHGNLWLGLPENGLIRFSMDGSSIRLLEHFKNIPSNNRSLCDNSIWSLYEDHAGNIWIGGESGVSKYTYNTQRFSQIGPCASYYNFENMVVKSIVTDSEKNIWIGSLSDTIYFISPVQKKSSKILCTEPGVLKGVNQLLVTKNKLYIGSYNGLYIMEIPGIDALLSKPFYRGSSIAIRNEGVKEKKLTSNTIQTLFEDHSGMIWIGTGKGINRLDPSTLKSTTLYENPNAAEVNASYIIRCITQSADGIVWIGTDNGLFESDPDHISFSGHFHTENDSVSLPDNAISYIFESRDGTLWMGTGKGLSSYDRKKKRFSLHALSTSSNYFSVASIAEDTYGNLWVSSNQGLFRYIPGETKINHFTVKNGLCTNRFVPASVSVTKDGLLFFGGEKGFIAFYPDSIPSNPLKPPVVITDFKLFDESVFSSKDTSLIAQLLSRKKLTLNYDQNFFSIDFAALNYLFPEANQYAYQLEGIDKNWVSAGNRRTASYTNVPPSTYRFRVKGANNDGVWNNDGASLEIVVLPPWWKTWWFYLLSTIAFALILYSIYRYRINQIKKVFAIRSKIARDLHDDIGSTLSSISLMSQLAKDGTGDKDKEQELFNTISNASKEAMDLMGVIVWSVNPNNDKLGNILVRMREYASDILEASDIDFNIQLDDEVKDVIIPMEKRKDFYLIFKEAVNNTAKYSGARHALIKLLRENGKLLMTVEDDGKGFDMEKLRSGNGLVNMNQRAKFIGGRLNIHSENGKGTSVRLEMPLVT